jgi:tetratricopeptide (TPR) repeat protein
MRATSLTILLMLFAAHPAHADNWVKVKSPHFLVISDGSESQARHIAQGFEEIHAVFNVALPGLRTDSGAETIVIAVKDEHSFVTLEPFEKKMAAFRAGEFHKGWERDYVIVRLDFPDQTRDIVYHEYIHKLLHLNFTRLPVWLDEGLAEFFGNTLMRSDGTFMGAPSPRIDLLRSGTLYPIQTVLTVVPSSPYYRDESKVQMFYAEAWGLTHFLVFGDHMGGGQKLNAYLGALQDGADSVKAFDETFGNRKDVEKNFQFYTTRLLFNAAKLDKLPEIKPSSFPGGPMPRGETDAMLGGFYTKLQEMDAANAKLTAALSEDPKSALAHENEAFYYFQQGRDEDAQKEFDQSVSLDPNGYLAIYYQALMKYHGKSDADSLAQLDAAMDKVMKLDPNFAPALVVRSQILVRQRKLQDALNISVKARDLEPDRAGYQTNSAAILLLGHNYPAAVKMAAAVAARWSASDSAEALAVVAQARRLGKIEQTPEEKTREDQEMEYAKDTTPVEGTIQSVQCEKSKPMELVLLSGQKSLNFRAGKEFGVGFSDTLWYGADHFNPCHHIEGMNALVRYKPPANSTDVPEMWWLEIRDEIIPSSLPPDPADKPAAAPAVN